MLAGPAWAHHTGLTQRGWSQPRKAGGWGQAVTGPAAPWGQKNILTTLVTFTTQQQLDLGNQRPPGNCRNFTGSKERNPTSSAGKSSFQSQGESGERQAFAHCGNQAIFRGVAYAEGL